MATMATPLTSLETFRRLAQYHPWHFWGLAGASGATSVVGQGANKNNCRPILRQYGWQAGDAVSREQIAQVLQEAEHLITEQLAYPIAPQFRTATLAWPAYHDRRLVQVQPIGSDSRWQSVALPDGMLRAIGIESITLLATAAYLGPFPYAGPTPAVGTLVYVDTDGDDLIDQAQIRITDASTPLDEIAVYVAAADRFDGSDRSERWRLHPSIATRSGTTVTIRLPAWLCVQPVRYEGANANALNGLTPTDSDVYLQTVEVCRRRCDPTGTTAATAQAALIWEVGPWPWCATPTETDPAGIRTAVARAGIRDADLGLVTPVASVYDATTQTWSPADCGTWWGCRPPDRVEVRYLAGRARSASGETAAPWDRLVTGMAAAMLGRPLAGCKDTASLIEHWQTDVTRAAGGTTFQAQPRANNPFGPRIGQIDAYAQVSHDRLTRGHSM